MIDFLLHPVPWPWSILLVIVPVALLLVVVLFVPVSHDYAGGRRRAYFWLGGIQWPWEHRMPESLRRDWDDEENSPK